MHHRSRPRRTDPARGLALALGLRRDLEDLADRGRLVVGRGLDRDDEAARRELAREDADAAGALAVAELRAAEDLALARPADRDLDLGGAAQVVGDRDVRAHPCARAREAHAGELRCGRLA